MAAKKGVVITLGASGEWDDASLSTTSYNSGTCRPSVALCLRDNYVWAYFTGHNGGTQRIGLACSQDGVNFIRKGVIIPLGASGASDDYAVWYPSVVWVGNYCYLYYTGLPSSPRGNVSLAVSKDGINFTKKGHILIDGASGDYDELATGFPSIVYKDNIFYLYYGGESASYDTRICVATSKDGENFTKKGVVIPQGGSGEWDSTQIYSAKAIVYGEYVFLLYNASEYSAAYYNFIGLAVSKDGINFVRKGPIRLHGTSGDYDDSYQLGLGAIIKDNCFWIYHYAHDGSTSRMGVDIFPVETYCNLA